MSEKNARIIIDREIEVSQVDERIFASFIEHLGRAVYEGIYQPGLPVSDEDGKLVMAYHARPYDEIIGDPLYDANRHAYLMDIPVEDGRPEFCYSNNRINP